MHHLPSHFVLTYCTLKSITIVEMVHFHIAAALVRKPFNKDRDLIKKIVFPDRTLSTKVAKRISE